MAAATVFSKLNQIIKQSNYNSEQIENIKNLIIENDKLYKLNQKRQERQFQDLTKNGDELRRFNKRSRN